MNKNISDIFDYGSEIAPEEADISFDPASIKALTFEKLTGTNPFREGKRKMNVKTKRIVFLAAAILMALMCSAFAFYKFGVIDLILPEDEYSSNYTRVSVTGWQNSPEYLALTKWQAYENEYNSTHEIPNIVSDDIPIEYQMTGAWNYEMEDTLRGILDKYGLKLHDSAFVNLPAEGSGIDTDAILGGKAYWVGGYAYSDGTMLLDASMTNDGGSDVSVNLFNSVKGTFTNISGGFRIGTDYEEWEYTAADGTPLVLGLSGREAIIIADMERVFVMANVTPADSREALEAVADTICWTMLNDCTGYSAGFYAQYAAEQAELNKEDLLAYEAENEMHADYGLTMSVGVSHEVVVYGRPSAESEDGSVWVERRFCTPNSDSAISFKYERYTDNAEAELAKRLADYGMTDAEEIESTPVYITEEPDGALAAVWYNESVNLIFTIESDAGELTQEELRQQIVYVITGRDTTGFEWAPVTHPVTLPAEGAEIAIPDAE